MKKILALVFSLLASAASATSYYISDCGTGANGSCVAGSDAAAGTSTGAAWQSTTKVNTIMSSLVAGDTINIAQGGAWNAAWIFSATNYSTDGSNPVVIQSYTPSWCTGGCIGTKPKLTATAGTPVIQYGSFGGAGTHCGLTVKDLELIGLGDNGTDMGVGAYNGTCYLVMDNLYIHDAQFGFDCEWTQGGQAGSQNYITLRNSNLYNNHSSGVLAGGDDATVNPSHGCNHLLIEKNTFSHNGWKRATLDHAIYITGNYDTVIRANTFTAETYATTGNAGCGSTVIVSHDTVFGMLIEGNFFDETAVVANDGCYLIGPGTAGAGGVGNGVVDDLRDVVIRGNKGIGGGSAVSINSIQRSIVENNIFSFTDATHDHICIGVQKMPYSNTDPDATGGPTTIRNNTCYMGAGTLGSTAFYLNEIGAGHIMSGNVAYFDTGASASATCFFYDTHTSSDFAVADYNQCFRVGGVATWSNKGNLATTQGLGFDTNSVTTDPSLLAVPASGNAYVPKFTAALAAGHSGRGSSKNGFAGKVRNGANRDRGACVWRTGDQCSLATTSVPNSPSQGIAQ